MTDHAVMEDDDPLPPKDEEIPPTDPAEQGREGERDRPGTIDRDRAPVEEERQSER